MAITNRRPTKDKGAIIISLLFIAIYLFEAASKYYRHEYNNTPSNVPRVVFLLVCIMIIISRLNIKSLGFIFACLFATAWFMVGLVFNDSIIGGDVISSAFQFFKYISGLLVMYAFYTCTNKKILANTFFYLFIFNCLAAIVSFIFDIEWMRTYGHIRDINDNFIDSRFGFNGFILEQNISTFFYVAGLYCTYFQVKYAGKSCIYILIAIFGCLIIGTKSIFLSLLFIPAFLFIKKNNIKLLFFTLALAVVVVLLVGVNIVDYDTLNEILSFRPYNYVNRLSPLLDSYDVFNLIFGLQISDYTEYLTEFEIVDMVSFFGVVVTFIYLILFVYLCYIFGVNSNNKELIFNYALTISFISFLSGHLFYDPISMIYTAFG
ncbi:TPA: hypothetical protein ACW4HH_004789, partial [Salmonella enterica subsp. enterica serovar Schwarzengrund]